MFSEASSRPTDETPLVSWQVIVVRVDVTPARDSSEQESPCDSQNRRRPMDMNNSLDNLVYNAVQRGPVGPQEEELLAPHGPKVKGPLALWVLIYARLTDQWTDSHCATGFCEPELDPTINRNMDSRPMVGTTYLERPAPAVYLDSQPTEGKVIGPLVLWVLIYAKLADQRTDSHRTTGFWEPELDPTINHSLDSRPIVGTTYLEHLAPAVYLDSRPTEGKVRSKNLEWKPMRISVINCKLDSQPMVWITYLERPAPAVYFDSWPMEAKVRSKQREWRPVIFPPDSYTLDSQPMVGTTYLERPAPAVYLDSWLMEGASCPEPQVDWEVLSSKPSLNNVAIVKMVDTDTSDDVKTQLLENVILMPTPMTAPAWPCVESPRSSRRKDSREIEMTRPENAPPMEDPIVIQKKMPEYLTPMSTPMTSLTWPCVDSPRSPMVEYDSVNRMKDGRKIKMTRPENAPPMEDPIVRQKKRPENLTPKSTPMTSLTWPCVDSLRSPTVEYDSVNRMKDGRKIEMTRPVNAPPIEDPFVTQKKMPENLSPMSTLMTSLTWPCVDSPQSPTVEYDSVNRMKDGRKIEMTRPGSVPPIEDPIVIQKKRPENLTPKSTPTTSLTRPCVDSPRSATVEYDSVKRMKDSREIEMTRPENVTIKNMLKKLTSVSTPMTSLAWPCVDSPRLPMGKHEIVVRMKDSRERKISEVESGPPTQDSNWSMKYWEDRICHPLIYVGDFPYNVLKTTSHNPEVADVQHEAGRMFTFMGRTATRTGGWLDMKNTSDTDSVAELEYNTWDDARAWEFRNARGNMDVSLFQNSQIEMNRADESEVDTVIGYDVDHSARKRVSRRWEYQCTPTEFPASDAPPTLVRDPASDGKF